VNFVLYLEVGHMIPSIEYRLQRDEDTLRYMTSGARLIRDLSNVRWYEINSPMMSWPRFWDF
jgi:hypothetical protein